MLSYFSIIYDLYCAETDRLSWGARDILLYADRDTFLLVFSIQSILFMRRTRFVLHVSKRDRGSVRVIVEIGAPGIHIDFVSSRLVITNHT